MLTYFVCVLGSFTGADAPAAPAPRPIVRPAPTKDDRLAELLAKLNAPVDDPVPAKDVTVGEYVAKLSKAHGIGIVLNKQAYRAQQGNDWAGEQKLWLDFPKGMRLVTVLRVAAGTAEGRNVSDEDLAEKGDASGGLLVRDGYVELVPVAREYAEFGRPLRFEGDPERELYLPGVSVLARNRCLADLLHELAAANNVNVVVSAKATKLAETKVSVRFLNVSLDTALATLAQQAELEIVLNENIFLVTTPEHAAALRRAKEWADDKLEANRRAQANLPWFGQPDGYFRPTVDNPPPADKVTFDFAEKPLADVLNRLRLDGFNVTLDPVAAKKAEAKISLKLKGVSCEAAVKQAAELAGLRAVRLDNSLFITTPEKADRLAAPPAVRKAAKPKKGKGP